MDTSHRYQQYLARAHTLHQRLIILEDVFIFTYGYMYIEGDIPITLPFTHYY
jgi:hypothetical protein